MKLSDATGKVMKISDAIKLLKEHLKRYGDLEMGMSVSAFDGMNCEAVSQIIEIGDFVVTGEICLCEGWTDIDDGYLDTTED